MERIIQLNIVAAFAVWAMVLLCSLWAFLWFCWGAVREASEWIWNGRNVTRWCVKTYAQLRLGLDNSTLEKMHNAIKRARNKVDWSNTPPLDELRQFLATLKDELDKDATTRKEQKA